MKIIATAGHIDHGKSTLIEALTGTHPDRLIAERERGLTIELGYAWAEFDGVGTVAFVDVPGHEKFISTMLAGVGPAPACLFVVAADDPWMPQAAEHLAVVNGLGVSRGVVAVTRSDLTDPGPMIDRARQELTGTTLAGAPIVGVSSLTGTGIADLRAALTGMVATVPVPDPGADVRLWADRKFTITGAGTVITGTLTAGTIRVGDALTTAHGLVHVRAIQSLNAPQDSVSGTARVALNLTGATHALSRGDVLWSPRVWPLTTTIDVRVVTGTGRVPRSPVLHIGSTAVSVRARLLEDAHARLTLPGPLPLRQGDRALVRDPGNRQVWGVRILDPLPAPFTRRGAPQARARTLRQRSLVADFDTELAQRGVVSADTLRQLGIRAAADRAWFMSPTARSAAGTRLRSLVIAHDAAHPHDPGISPAAAAQRLGLPAPHLVVELVAAPLRVDGGRITSVAGPVLPPRVTAALAALDADFRTDPFGAPTQERLDDLGLSPGDLGAAAKARRVFLPAPGIVLPATAAGRAATALRGLPQPFTTSQARQRLGTSRRVVIPILEFLDRARITRRLPDDRREIIGGGS